LDVSPVELSFTARIHGDDGEQRSGGEVTKMFAEVHRCIIAVPSCYSQET
jgi:hypothetical protein